MKCRFVCKVGMDSIASPATTAASATIISTIAVSTSTAVVATAATASTAAISAATTLFAWLGFVDSQGASAKIFAIKSFDGRNHLVLGAHGYKGEATWAATITIHGHVNIGNSAIVGEELLELIIACLEGQIAHIHFHINGLVMHIVF